MRTWVGNDDNTPTVKVTGGGVLLNMEEYDRSTKDVPYHYFKTEKSSKFKSKLENQKLATEFSPKDYVYTKNIG